MNHYEPSTVLSDRTDVRSLLEPDFDPTEPSGNDVVRPCENQRDDNHRDCRRQYCNRESDYERANAHLESRDPISRLDPVPNDRQ